MLGANNSIVTYFKSMPSKELAVVVTEILPPDDSWLRFGPELTKPPKTLRDLFIAIKS